MQLAAQKPLEEFMPASMRGDKETFLSSPSMIKGLTGALCATADIVLLSTLLIILAVDANGAHFNLDLSHLLEMRLSIENLVTVVVCSALWRLIFYYSGFYALQSMSRASVLAMRIVLASLPASFLAGSVIAFTWGQEHVLRYSIVFWTLSVITLLMLRGSIAIYCLYVHPALRTPRSVIIVGTGHRAMRVSRELHHHPDWNYKVLGFVTLQPGAASGPAEGTLGSLSDLEEILMTQPVDEVITVLPVRSSATAIEEAVAVCERAGVQVQYYADLFETSVTKSICREGHGRAQRVVLKMVHDDHRHYLKRALDILGASVGLTLLSPLFLLVAILIKCTSSGPVFFRQKRYGLNRRIFNLYKFRSMVVDAEAKQVHLEHLNQFQGPAFKIFGDPRITRIGRLLRRTSIDELPQLFNVLRGDMALVGPRPMSLRDVGKFSELRLMRRFSVKPGITCIWQVCGRSNVTFDHWMNLDLHYIDNWSLALDMKILAQTVPAVLTCKGAV